MRLKRMSFDRVEAKSDQTGEFEAYASIFGNVDLVGDRMIKGAFAKTLARWRDSGDPIPVILSHNHDDPMAIVGSADPRAVVETDEGLLVQGQLDLADNPVAKQTYKLMKNRLLKGWSFGYTIPEGGAKKARDGAIDVTEVDLIEVGPTLKGANPQARLEAIKSLPDLGDAGLEPEIVVGGETFTFAEAREVFGFDLPKSGEAAILLKWNGAASNYSDEEYVAATVLDRAVCDETLRDAPAKQRYSLPIATPGNSAADSPDRDGVVAAAARLGSTDACSAAKMAAAKRLVRAYGKFSDLTVPDSVKALAGEASNDAAATSKVEVTASSGAAASTGAGTGNGTAPETPSNGSSGHETSPEDVRKAVRETIRETVRETVAEELAKRRVDDSDDAAPSGKSEQDPLRKRGEELELELFGSDAAPRRKTEEKEPEPDPAPEEDLGALERRAHDLILDTLTE